MQQPTIEGSVKNGWWSRKRGVTESQADRRQRTTSDDVDNDGDGATNDTTMTMVTARRNATTRKFDEGG
jgi:hypothetical protein